MKKRLNEEQLMNKYLTKGRTKKNINETVEKYLKKTLTESSRGMNEKILNSSKNEPQDVFSTFLDKLMTHFQETDDREERLKTVLQIILLSLQYL